MSGIDPRIKENVHFTLKGNVRFVSPDEFFENLLHGAAVGDNVNRALDVVKAKHYCEKRWNGFPLWSDEETVDEYIKPFANIVQVINEACQPYAPSDAVKTTWLDCYSESPTHRPGLPCIVQAAASTSRHVKDLNKKLSQTSKLSQDRKELLRIWWRHAHAIVDVVPRMPQDVESLQKAVVRLCAHITRLFREQPDRHFVKVLLLCSDELALWYCDHVGLVGTLNPINMHEDPDQFMRILAAFSMLSADQLGWDPMMKIYQGKGEDALPSYLLPHDRLLATTTWCISMPSEGNRERREEFVTIRQLTGFPAFICGCATMVWEAVKREDFEKGNLDMCPDTPVFVLKQAWQPVTNDSDEIHEVKMHKIAQLDEAYYSYEIVKTANDIAASTQSIRKSVETKFYAEAIEKPAENGTPESTDSEDDEPSYRAQSPPYFGSPPGSISYTIFSEGGDEIYPRHLVRLLTKNYGYRLECFADNLELITVLRDAVREHEILYDNGILHRDVSSGNVLIRDFPYDITEGRRDGGMLIDLDRAKHTSQWINHPCCKPLSEEHLAISKHCLSGYPELTDEDFQVISQLFDSNISKGLKYLRYKLEQLPASLKNVVGNGVKFKLKPKLPDFNYDRVNREKLMGTFPFTSVELTTHYYPYDKTSRVHNAVHDMESFFWVLLYLCLTRDGNTGRRRPELNYQRWENPLARLVHGLFDDESMNGDDKQWRSFKSEEEFTKLLDWIHPYFNCFKDLLLKWRWLLFTAHLYEGVEYYYIHNVVLAVLDETIEGLKRQQKEDSEYDEQGIMEYKRMRRETMRNWSSTTEIPAQDEHRSERSASDGRSPVSQSAASSAAAAVDLPESGPRKKRRIY